jgi:H/ACA ribonucleoprotein complex subunit 4
MEILLPFEKNKPEILIKKQGETSPKFGCNPNERPIKSHIKYGIINIDKPQGPTSHQVSAYLQKILGIDKAGHSGTLDPNVTGVLPIAIENATKIVQALLPAGKEYVCVMHLHGDYEEEEIRKACESFVGKIKQMPPLKSAIKRQLRWRRIYYLKVLQIKGRDVLFQVGCQAGTYIRTLCVDIGKKLGSNGHMQELRRTKAAGFKEDSLCTLQDITDAWWYYKNEDNETFLRKCILPMEVGVRHIPKVWIIDTAVNTICHGASLKVPGVAKLEADIEMDKLVAIMTRKNELVALAKMKMISREVMQSDKGIVATLERVFMEPGTYPKIG